MSQPDKNLVRNRPKVARGTDGVGGHNRWGIIDEGATRIGFRRSAAVVRKGGAARPDGRGHPTDSSTRELAHDRDQFVHSDGRLRREPPDRAGMGTTSGLSGGVLPMSAALASPKGTGGRDGQRHPNVAKRENLTFKQFSNLQSGGCRAKRLVPLAPGARDSIPDLNGG